jgi:hypothetical protein
MGFDGFDKGISGVDVDARILVAQALVLNAFSLLANVLD